MINLNNREISTLIWLVIFFCWALSQAPIRSAFFQLLRTFFVKPILVSVTAMIAYVAICVTVLCALGIWEPSNLKATLVWVLVFAFATMMQIQRINDDRAFYLKTARETANITAALLFVTEFYTFSLVVELMVVPAITLLVMLEAFSGTKEESSKHNQILNRILGLAGLSLLAYAIYQLHQDWSNFATLTTAREFATPILLSILFLPFIFALSTYSIYENIFARVRLRVENKQVLDYAMAHAMLAFRANADLLRRWAREITLNEPITRKDVRRSIRHIKAIKERERSPPKVAAEDGWSPYSAMKFLEEHGLKPGDYHRSYGGWCAQTPYIGISNDVLPDQLAYYVEGDDTAARQLKLILDVMNPNNSKAADEKFVAVATTLINKSTGGEIDRLSILNDDWNVTISGKQVSVRREQWRGLNSDYAREMVVMCKPSDTCTAS